MAQAAQRKRLYPKDVHIRLTQPVAEALAKYADLNYLAVNAAAREILKRGLDDQVPEQSGRLDQIQNISLAALLAAEHTLKLLQTIVPEGERRSIEAAPKAVSAAEERLNRVSLSRGREE